jgi:putative flippase GtrA
MWPLCPYDAVKQARELINVGGQKGRRTMGILQQLTRPTANVAWQAARYLCVGGIAFLADFGTLVALTEWASMHYALSAAFAFGVGLAVNYLLSVTWVFHHRVFSDQRTEFMLFAMIGVAGLGLTEVIMWCGTEVAGLDYRISKLIAVALVLFWNFAARKVLLFRDSST